MSPTTHQTKSTDGCVSGDITNQNNVAPGNNPVDSDEEDFAQFGYQPLAQDPANALASSDDDSDDGLDLEETQTAENGVAQDGSLITEVQCDQVIMGVLGSFDSVPCGGSGDASLYTDPLTDSTQVELWNSVNPEPKASIDLSPAKQDEIKACMANFQLPKSQIPEWAGVVPESEWKAKLLKTLGNNS